MFLDLASEVLKLPAQAGAVLDQFDCHLLSLQK